MIGNDQKFRLNNLSGALSIMGNNGLFVSSEDGAITGMTCSRSVPSSWEFFNWGITGTIPVNTKYVDVQENSFGFFPNPVLNNITVKAASDEKILVSIFDLNGKILLSTIIFGKGNNIDVSDIQPGIYFIGLADKNHCETYKFIKTN